jgi:hypothetical protein
MTHPSTEHSPAAVFKRILGSYWDKSLKSFLFTITSTTDFTPQPPLRKSGLKLVCNVNIVHGGLKSENSQDYSMALYVHEFGFWAMSEQLHSGAHRCQEKKFGGGTYGTNSHGIGYYSITHEEQMIKPIMKNEHT